MLKQSLIENTDTHIEDVDWYITREHQQHFLPLTVYKVTKPYNNRKLISLIAKKQKGVYMWVSLNPVNGCHLPGPAKADLYVGHSTNLYSRVISYFMPSLLKAGQRRVLRHFNKHGFGNTYLILFIQSMVSPLKRFVQLEQYLMDKYKPSLNVDLVASGTGFHEPISQLARDKLSKERGQSVYVYDGRKRKLLFTFCSKQLTYSFMKIHHTTLNKHLKTQKFYLDRFLFTLEPLPEVKINRSINSDTVCKETFLQIVMEQREAYKAKRYLGHKILALNVKDSSLNREFASLHKLANYLKGDRETLRAYIRGAKTGHYRKQWKFILLEKASRT